MSRPSCRCNDTAKLDMTDGIVVELDNDLLEIERFDALFRAFAARHACDPAPYAPSGQLRHLGASLMPMKNRPSPGNRVVNASKIGDSLGTGGPRRGDETGGRATPLRRKP
jgi:hypothetical protein